MFSTLLDKMGSAPRSASRPEVTRASPTASILTNDTIDASLDPQTSSSSTPPTSIGDEASISSTSLKIEATATVTLPALASTPTPAPAADNVGRSRRDRKSVATYNVKILTGTAVHAPKKYCKNADGTPVEYVKKIRGVARRRTISGDTLVEASKIANGSTDTIDNVTIDKDTARTVRDGIDALNMHWEIPMEVSRPQSQPAPAGGANKSAKKSAIKQCKSINFGRIKGDKVGKMSKKINVYGKRSLDSANATISMVSTKPSRNTPKSRELARLADTKEFAKEDTEPVIHEVWSNGKLVVNERPKKKRRIEESLEAVLEEPKPVEKAEKEMSGKREKTWLSKGVYAGQDLAKLCYYDRMPKGTKLRDDYTAREAKASDRSLLPLPVLVGQKLLHTGRDFKLPFDVCSPLPPGQPKPDDWRKTNTNRFVGDAAAQWRKMDGFDSFSSKCVCDPEDGCDERCQNRIMLYECDDDNCNVGKDLCGNRAFANIMDRRKGAKGKGGNKYEIGVEVLKTADRGYGVRSNRCFEANQIIVEYTGEIITEEESDRRMNEIYKNNKCYYLMSFDQNMILDGTKGSIARFVNHSCKPNCRMVKWVVAGKARMALFAGDKPIMTGDELTYDYNFDPFSRKNVQECRCGSDNCRGVLGPKQKDPKPIKDAIQDALKAGVKSTVQAGKRKLKAFLGTEGENDNDSEAVRSPKKRKTKAAGLKRSASSASMIIAKCTAKAVKKSVSSRLANARQVVSVRRETTTTTKKRVKVNEIKTYGRTSTPSRTVSMTALNPKTQPRTPDKMSSVGKRLPKSSIARSVLLANGSSASKPYQSPYLPVSPTGSAVKGSTIRLVGNDDTGNDDTEDDI